MPDFNPPSDTCRPACLYSRRPSSSTLATTHTVPCAPAAAGWWSQCGCSCPTGRSTVRSSRLRSHHAPSSSSSTPHTTPVARCGRVQQACGVVSDLQDTLVALRGVCSRNLQACLSDLCLAGSPARAEMGHQGHYTYHVHPPPALRIHASPGAHTPHACCTRTHVDVLVSYCIQHAPGASLCWVCMAPLEAM